MKKIMLRLHEKITTNIAKRFHNLLAENPITLVDVGAANGTLSNFSIFGKCLRTVGFEPNKEAHDKLIGLQDKNTIILNTALADKRGEAEFFITKKPEASSLLQANKKFLKNFSGTDRYNVVQTVQLKVDTMDGALISNKINNVDFVKLDTQGNELNILKHGKKTMAGCFGVQIEVEFYQLYENQFVFSDIDAFMREQGYLLFDLQPAYWKRTAGLPYGRPKGQLIWADALYFKDPDVFFEQIRQMSDADKFLKSLKAVLMLACYGYIDTALAITEALRKTVKDGEVQKDISVVEKELKKKHFSYFLRNLPFRNALAAIAYHVYKALRFEPKNHIIRDRDIGNL